MSKRTEYGLRAVVQLARYWPNHLVQTRDLSSAEDLPNKFLESILLALRRGGFLESKVGSGGGYRLSRAPKDISVGDVIRRLEGRLTVKDKPPRPDASPGETATHLLNAKLSDAINEVLDAMSLEELVEYANRSGPTANAMYYI